MQRCQPRLQLQLQLLLVVCIGSGVVCAASTCVEVESTLFDVEEPVLLTHTPIPGDDRVFVVSKRGYVKVFERDGTLIDTFVNVTSLLPEALGNEQGLLGMAFNPDYETNGQVVINYTDGNGDTVIGDGRATLPYVNATRIDVNHGTILKVSQPFGNHNAGGVYFGPDDGFLYVPFGDGGGGGDPLGHGQNDGSFLGSVIRIKVDSFSGRAFEVPDDNPGTFGHPAIWAVGLRNPWRCSFGRPDPGQDALLFCGDVGQGAWEEVDIIQSGGNYGWRTMEGSCPFDPELEGCIDTSHALPIGEYSHNIGRSVAGGYLIQQDSPYDASVHGRYVFGDLATDSLLDLQPEDISAPLTTSWSLQYACSPAPLADTQLYSFGQDSDGYIYILRWRGSDETSVIERISAMYDSESPGSCPHACPVLQDNAVCGVEAIPNTSDQCKDGIDILTIILIASGAAVVLGVGVAGALMCARRSSTSPAS